MLKYVHNHTFCFRPGGLFLSDLVESVQIADLSCKFVALQSSEHVMCVCVFLCISAPTYFVLFPKCGSSLYGWRKTAAWTRSDTKTLLGLATAWTIHQLNWNLCLTLRSVPGDQCWLLIPELISFFPMVNLFCICFPPKTSQQTWRDFAALVISISNPLFWNSCVRACTWNALNSMRQCRWWLWACEEVRERKWFHVA